MANGNNEKEYKFYSLGEREVQEDNLFAHGEPTVEAVIYLGTYSGSLEEARHEIQSRYSYGGYQTDPVTSYSARYYVLCDIDNTVLDVAATNSCMASHRSLNLPAASEYATQVIDTTAIQEAVNRMGYHKLAVLTPAFIDELNNQYISLKDDFLKEMSSFRAMMDGFTNAPSSMGSEQVKDEKQSADEEHLRFAEMMMRFEKEEAIQGTSQDTEWPALSQEMRHDERADTESTAFSKAVDFPQPVHPAFILQLRSAHPDDMIVLRRLVEEKLDSMKGADFDSTNTIISQLDKHNMTIGTKNETLIETIRRVLNKEIERGPIGCTLSSIVPIDHSNRFAYKEMKFGNGPQPEYTPEKMAALRDAVLQHFSAIETENSLLFNYIQEICKANQFYTLFAMPDSKTLHKMEAIAAQQPAA